VNGVQDERLEVGMLRASEIEAAASIFERAFEGSLDDLFGAARPLRSAVVDFFGFVHEVERECFFAGRVDGQLAGYCMSPSSMPRLWTRAFFGGYIIRWARRCLAGEYGAGISIRNVFRDKLRYLIYPRNYASGRAQILSIAVDERYRRRGLARAMLEASIEYLRSKGAGQVKLDVRPENSGALRLYEKLGFARVGSYEDSCGPWDVMVLEL